MQTCRSPALVTSTSIFFLTDFLALGKFEQPIPESRSFQRTASSCSRNDFRNLRENITNKALDGQVIIWHKVITALQCSDYCLREPGCYGFNLETITENKICELLGFGSNIVDRPGFSYWIFDRVSYEKVIYNWKHLLIPYVWWFRAIISIIIIIIHSKYFPDSDWLKAHV